MRHRSVRKLTTVAESCDDQNCLIKVFMFRGESCRFNNTSTTVLFTLLLAENI